MPTREEKEGKKNKNWRYKKKSEISFIHPDERRMMSSEYSTEEERDERLTERFSRVNLYRCGVCSGRRR